MEGTKSFSHEQNGTALTSDLLVRMALNLSTHISHGRNQSSHHDGMAQPLHLTYSSEWPCISALSLGGSLDLENTKSLSKVLKLQPRQWLRQYISYLFLHRNIQELHCSSQYASTCMEHWIL